MSDLENKILAEIRNFLKANADQKIRESRPRYFKSGVECYGFKTATIQKLAKQMFQQIKEQPKHTIFELCENLWQSAFIEEGYIACMWAEAVYKKYDLPDFKIFERWVSTYVNNWASCDVLCTGALGKFVQLYPECVPQLKKWTTSTNRWQKRAAAVALIPSARKGLMLNDIFDVAKAMLEDNDDMVQKGYGWLLKETANQKQDDVFDFVMRHKASMPRTALRYAIEKMPKDRKSLAMSK